MVKVLEKLIANHISSFLEKHNLLSTSQYGFRPGLSCSSQLVHLFHTWASVLDNGKITVFLGFQKGFDSVPYRRLIFKIQQYGITGQTLNWLSDFLSNRRQRVAINGSNSYWAYVFSGVPHGIIVGSLLFLLVLNDILECLSCSSDMFVDDTLLNNSASPCAVSYTIQDSLHRILTWCNQWLLNMNATKFESLRITRCKIKLTVLI